jgi:hypothetical protein
MLSLKRRSTARSLVTALLIACLFSLSVPIAVAADGRQNSDKIAGREAPSSEALLECLRQPPRVLYAVRGCDKRRPNSQPSRDPTPALQTC